jgi:hypothetical protein
MNDPWPSLEYAEWKDTLHAVHMIWSATAGSMGFSRTATARWSAGATRRRGSATPRDRRGRPPITAPPSGPHADQIPWSAHNHTGPPEMYLKAGFAVRQQFERFAVVRKTL